MNGSGMNSILEMLRQGRDYWHQYVCLNGFAWSPTEEGLKRLSRNLDLNIPHLRECITAYLEA